MAWKRRDPKHAWRDYLTKDEAKEIDEIERLTQKTDAERRQFTARRNRIVNRAIQRARYAEGGRT